MVKEGRVLAFALFGMLLLLASNIEQERTLDLIVLFNGGEGLNEVKGTGVLVLEKFSIIDGVHVRASELQKSRIERLPSVEVYPNRILYPMLAESVPLIGASIAQAQGFNGSGVRVAIVDTGINATDSRLGSRVINQSDCTYPSCAANTPPSNNDSAGHGTLMAIISAGNPGVAPNASIMDAKIAQTAGGASEANVVKGMQYALNPDGQEATKDGADVILLSFGQTLNQGDFCAGAASAAIDTAVSRGVSVIVANGDTGCVNSTTYPACSRKAIAVGSTVDNASTTSLACPVCAGGGSSAQGVDSWFCGSSRGYDNAEGKIKPDLVAPGHQIRLGGQEYYGADEGSYTLQHGSSIAAAHVAGAAAIVMQKVKANWGELKDPNPDTPGSNSSTAALKAILLNSANELGASGRDTTYGAGRLNVTEALRQANSSYVQYCNRWSGEISPSVKLYHNISVPSGAANLSVTLYWEENNRTTHKNLDLSLKDPGFTQYTESSPANDVVRQIRVGSPASGLWHAVVEDASIPQTGSKYVVVSNYPLGGCQPPTLTTVNITFYNGTAGQAHSVKDTVFPSNSYDYLEEYNRGTQVVQYVIGLYDQFGQLFESTPSPTLTTKYTNGSSTVYQEVPISTPLTSMGTSTSWTSGNPIPIPDDAAATDASHTWKLKVSVGGCAYGCDKNVEKEFYVNKTHGSSLSVSGPAVVSVGSSVIINVNITNLGNVADGYTIGFSNNFTANTAGLGTSGRCSMSISGDPHPTTSFRGTANAQIEVTAPATLTGGDRCWMELINSTSDSALFLVKNTTTDNGTISKASDVSPVCAGLLLNSSNSFVYFTHTPKGSVYVKETDLAIRAFPDTVNWSKDNGKLYFRLWYAKDTDGNFVPDTGEAYRLAFTRTTTSADTLAQIEVNSTTDNVSVGALWQLQQSSMGAQRFLLLGGQRYSFKVEVLDADQFQLGTSIPSGENAAGGCTYNVLDNNSNSPSSSCLCTSQNGRTVFARFFGHDAKYGYTEVTGVEVYVNDSISFLSGGQYNSQVCEGELADNTNCDPWVVTNHNFYRNSTKIYFMASPKSHRNPSGSVDSTENFVWGASVGVTLYDGNGTLVNAAPYSVPCSNFPCRSAATMAMPHYNSLSQVAKVGSWTANFSASASYFAPASQLKTFTVRGITNISISNAQAKYYRGLNYTFNATVRNEFGDVEAAGYYSVVWELHNGTSSKAINTSKDFRYVFTEETGLINISANASGTYLDASTFRAGAELWDRLNSSITIVPDPDYQLGSYVNFSMNVTRAFREPAAGVNVTCNITSSNLGNGTNIPANFSAGLWNCRQQLNKETTLIGGSNITVRAFGSYYENSTNSLSFTILGANLSTAVTAPSYAYMGTNFNFSFNITNRGNWNGSNAHFNLTLPTQLVRASGNWSERDLNDSEALGHNLQTGESFAYTWAVNASSTLGNYTMNLSVTADNAQTVLVVSPLEIRSTMEFSVQNPVLANATIPVNISANITNVGSFNITNANVSAILPADIQLTGGNQSYRFNLNVGQARSLYWEVTTDLGGNFTVLLNVTSDNAGAFVRNTTLSFSNNLYVRILSPNSSARANVSDYGNFTAILNITHNRTVIADLFQSNFSAQIGAYPAAISNVTFQNGLWNLTVSAPQELSESLNYDLRVRVLYFNQSLNRTYNASGASVGAVHSRETVPLILNFSLPPSFSAGNQSRMNVSVYDKSELAYLSGTFYDLDGNVREYNFSKVSSSGYYKNYTLLYTPSVEGWYNLTLTAMDLYGTNSTNSTNFSVYGPPRIRNIFFPNSRYLILGENASFVVNATSHVSAITVAVNVTNATATTTYDTLQTQYGYNFSRNFSAPGTYYVNAVVNDTYGNRMNLTDFFTVSAPIRVFVYFNLTGSVSLNPAGTQDPRATLTTESYADIPSGTYDIYARTSDGNLTVKLNSVALATQDTATRTISIAPSTITSSAFASYNAYSISTNFSYPSILLSFKYPAYYNTSRTYLYKCSAPAWNGTGCNGTWARLGTSVDINSSTASSSATSLSGFAVGQEHVLTNRIVSIVPSTGVSLGTAVNISFNVSLDGNPQAANIIPSVWFYPVALNTSGYSASGYIHNITASAPALTSLTRNVIVEARYTEPGAADSIAVNDTLVDGVTYYSPPWCGDGICSGNETSSSCSADCGSTTTGGGGGGGYTAPILTNYTTPNPALLILEYPSSVSVQAGNSASSRVSVKNTGNIALNVSIKFDELTLWITSPGSRSIALNASAAFDIQYSIPEYAQAGQYPYQIKAIANNFYNSTLALKTSQLNITSAAQAANATPPPNATPFTPPTAEGRHAELKDSYQKARNDLKKIGLFGYNVSALERELAKVGPLLDDAAGNLTSPEASEKMDLASAKMEVVREDAKGAVSERYSTISKEKPEYADVLSQAEAALSSGDFGKAAYLLNSIETRSAVVSAPAGTSIAYSILLIAVLLAIGGAGYYNKEEIKLRVEDLTQKSVPMQIEDVHSKSKALLGKRVSLKGTVVASGAREEGFWLKTKDRTGEILVWSRSDRSIGELIEVHGVVSYDKSIETWYVEARAVKGSGA